MPSEQLAELYREALRLTESQGLAIAREDWESLEALLAERQHILDRAAPLMARVTPGDPALDPARAALREMLTREADNQAALAALQAGLESQRKQLSHGAGALARYRVTVSAESETWYIDDAR